MYGLIGKVIAAEGQRDALIEIILEGSDAMPGCLSYIVAKDAAKLDAIWITEVWDSKASHEASLSLPRVQASIRKAMPLVAGFEASVETEPVGETLMHCQREREAALRLAQMVALALKRKSRRGVAKSRRSVSSAMQTLCRSEWQRGDSWVGGRTRSGRRDSSCVGMRRGPEAALSI